MLGISCQPVQSNVKDNLNAHRIAAKVVPHVLSEEHKENHVNTCQELQESLERDPKFLS
jgi:hypothetical protein